MSPRWEPVLRPRAVPETTGTPPRPARIEAPPPTRSIPGNPPIRSLHVHLALAPAALTNIINQDIGFARWLYINAATSDSGGPVPDLQDAVWVRVDDNAAVKASIGLYVHLVNGFRRISWSYIDKGPGTDGVLIDVLFGENSNDFIMRPFVQGLDTWGSPGSAFPLEIKPPPIW